MKILFVSSVSLISNASAQTKELLINDCGLPLEPHAADSAYLYSEKIEGSKHFGIWPLTQAAEACFGRSSWPKEQPTPQVCIELEVESAAAVAAAEVELRERGHRLLHATRTEPWGQTVCRLLTAEGAILGISFAPWLHS
ncbi:MAG TPA: hypothetical protein VFK05_05840 [Polyangiaceae bacterium]|nr:hypothetical protein [Polyangiaceae bacterium]